MYFTGSDFFNTQMRIIALEKNFTLSEYSLCPLGISFYSYSTDDPQGENGTKGDPVPITSEEDIFTYLGMKFKTPEERNL
jgi:DNA polymerase beta